MRFIVQISDSGPVYATADLRLHISSTGSFSPCSPLTLPQSPAICRLAGFWINKICFITFYSSWTFLPWIYLIIFFEPILLVASKMSPDNKFNYKCFLKNTVGFFCFKSASWWFYWIYSSSSSIRNSEWSWISVICVVKLNISLYTIGTVLLVTDGK